MVELSSEEGTSRSLLYILLPGVAQILRGSSCFNSSKKTPQRSVQNIGFYLIPDVAKLPAKVSGQTQQELAMNAGILGCCLVIAEVLMNYQSHIYQLVKENKLQAWRTRVWGVGCVLEEEQPNCRWFHWAWGSAMPKMLPPTATCPKSVFYGPGYMWCHVMSCSPHQACVIMAHIVLYRIHSCGASLRRFTLTCAL